MLAKTKTAKTTTITKSRAKRKSNPLLLSVTRPISRKLGLAFLAVFVLVGGYALYAASHAAGTPEMALARGGLCLDDYADRTANNSIVDVWTCNGSAAQRWVKSGNYVKVNGKCLDAQAWGTANGTHVNLYACNGGANQQWYWRTATHGYELVNLHANKCLDDTAYGNSGTRVELWTCTGGTNQLWHPAFYNPPATPTPTASAASPTPTLTSSPTPSPSPSSAPTAACSAPANDYGTDSMDVSIPTDGNYTVWVRMLAPDTASNSIDLQVDEAACFHVGGSANMPAGSLTWVDYQSGDASTIPIHTPLTAGSHTLKLIGTEPGVEVDRIILTTDTTCVPTGGGDNCLSTASPSVSVTATPTPTPTPVSSSTQPAGIAGTWNMAFDDEFNGTALNTKYWSPSWFNGGKVNKDNGVYMLASNVKETGGNLILTLSSSSDGATVDTDPSQTGGDGFTFGTGYVAEARMYVPGNGSTVSNWPAWWTDGQNWPTTGESDIFEGLGTATSNYHSPLGANNSGTISGTWTNGWHTYALDRESGKDYIYWDGRLVRSYSSDDGGAPQYLIFSHDCSGGCVTGAQLKVDYVRVWKKG